MLWVWVWVWRNKYLNVGAGYCFGSGRLQAGNDGLVFDLSLAIEALAIDDADVSGGIAERAGVFGLHEEVVLACLRLGFLVGIVQLEDSVRRRSQLAREVQNPII